MGARDASKSTKMGPVLVVTARNLYNNSRKAYTTKT